MPRPVVIVSFFDLTCSIGAQSICANLIRAGIPARLIHFGEPRPFQNAAGVMMLQCRGFLNISEIESPPDSLYEKCIDLIDDLDPILVGLSLDSRMTPFARRLTEFLRSRRPDLPVVWGGIHAIIDPEHCLRFVETVCYGEGEEAIVEMVRRLESGERNFRGIANVTGYTADGERYSNERVLLRDLSALAPPFIPPEYHLWLPEGSLVRLVGLSRAKGGHFFRAYRIMASRGCRFHCTYCYAETVQREFNVGGKEFVRVRSVDHVFEELRFARTLPYINFIWFWDDNFGLDLEWLSEFAERYPREIGLPFSIHIAPYTVTEERLKLLKKAGCLSAGVGMQSGSLRVQRDLYQRPFTREEVLRFGRLVHPQLPTFYDIITDNPYETEDDLRDTLDLFLDLPLPFGIASNTLLWYPNTSITRRALAEGVITDEDVVGHRTDGEYAYGDVTFREPKQDRKSRRLYSLNLLIAATQHAALPRETLREWSRQDDLLDRPEEVERRLLLRYHAESESDVLRLEDRVVDLEVEIAGLRAELERARREARQPAARTD